MNMDYDETNRGALFINDKKASDKHPDWRGRINVDGVDRWLSGWKKQTAKGPVLSLALGDPCEQQRPEPAPRVAPRSTTSKYPPSVHPADDENIPW